MGILACTQGRDKAGRKLYNSTQTAKPAQKQQNTPARLHDVHAKDEEVEGDEHRVEHGADAKGEGGHNGISVL